MFLLKIRSGVVCVCELCGNLDDDESWKAQRLDTFKQINLSKIKGAEFILLTVSREASREAPAGTIQKSRSKIMKIKLLAIYSESKPSVAGHADSLEEAFEKATVHYAQLVPFRDKIPAWYRAVFAETGEEVGSVNPLFCKTMRDAAESTMEARNK